MSVNIIQTLKNLNKEFPRFQLDTLLKIVDCIVEDYNYTTTFPTYKYNDFSTQPVYATAGSTMESGINFPPHRKNDPHIEDKTSNNQRILTEETKSEESEELEDIIKYITEHFS